jgi:hypothetical protein
MAHRTVALNRGARAWLDVELAGTEPLDTVPEYAVTAVDGYPAAAAWTATAWTTPDVVGADGLHRRTFRVLLAGPQAPTGAGETLLTADSLVYGRVVDTPLVLPAEPIRVTLR